MNSAMPPSYLNTTLFFRIDALVGQRDCQAFVQEGQLAQALLERGEIEDSRRHDGAVGLEGDAAFPSCGRLFQPWREAPWEYRRQYSCCHVKPIAARFPDSSSVRRAH